MLPLRLLVFLLYLLLVPTLASAVPLSIAGFGDSITCDGCNDRSYLSLLGGYLAEVPIIQDEASTTLTSTVVLGNLDDWLNDSGSADWVIVMAGTVDAYQEVGGFNNVAYSEALVVSNFDDMVDLVLGASMSILVVAPPPVQPNCGGAGVIITCADIVNRLDSLSTALAGLASSKSVPFVDLFDAYINHPDWAEPTGTALSLFLGDGLHPKYNTGDELNAFEIAGAINLSEIPEPSTGLLIGAGLVGLALSAQRRP